MYWRPDIAPAAVVLIAPSPDVVPTGITLAGLGIGTAASPMAGTRQQTLAEDGLWLRLPGTEALVLGDPNPDVGLALVLPLDPDFPTRLAASDRFWRGLTAQAPPDDLTPQRRGRIARALRALDAMAEGATYRAIATALFGGDRVASEVWKTGTLRAVTIRYVALGRSLIGGAWRALLGGRSARDGDPGEDG